MRMRNGSFSFCVPVIVGGVIGEITPVVSVAVLFAGVGSCAAAETVAVLVIVVPGLPVDLKTTVTVAEPFDATEPTEQVMVPVAPPTAGAVQVPCVVATETNVVPMGSTSVTVTASAALGPEL